ncbi:MAG: glycosyltransferase [Anaerostipes faecalis]|nr:glycosyltransferase [Anaerostipes faecalis]
MMNTKISIIMGIYNCASTLEEAINSILNQTYTNWEFVICDDGSVDNSYNIALEYQKKYPDKFIILKNKKNLGLNRTLNKCLKKSTGDYIARMDGDDISLPDRFEKEVNVLDHYPEYAIVSSQMITFDESGDWGYIKTLEKPQIKDFPTTVPMFCHAPCMIRRTAFLDVKGYTVDKKLLRVEDYHLWYKFYAKGYRGYNIQEPLYKMRDDRNALHRRTISARLNGIYATFLGFQMVHLPVWMYIYAVRNALMEIVKIIIPDKLYEYLHKKRLSRS